MSLPPPEPWPPSAASNDTPVGPEGASAASNDARARPEGNPARREPVPERRPDRVLLGIVAAIVALVVLALAVVFLRGEPQQLDPSSPAGVVQRYSKAVIDADPVAADAYLTDNVRSRCANFYGNVQASRVVLLGTTERESTATVRVSIVHAAPDGPFGPSEYAEEAAIGLVRVDGKWLINDLPYSLQTCAGGGLKK
ncbi:hypothetical protein [Arthrobacter sp. B3I4]|uniref:hypothetical protein n=1 Tax=Arthrobacter sp. B3I4 TaxID=3042267 RepID=UPI0027805222|nr:hypothetical protein [Arthrobacter sp. B3I4]MDQ0756256.1 hypothetical protein [Arthrobacter sp. B3I4]